jgi:hypothetical protein
MKEKAFTSAAILTPPASRSLKLRVAAGAFFSPSTAGKENFYFPVIELAPPAGREFPSEHREKAV